jgi:SAM-dependent methyltransferase
MLALGDAVRTGASAYVSVFGEPMWDRLDHEPADRAAFDALMEVLARQLSAPAALAFDWGLATEVVDLGGGTGVVLEAVLTEHPHLLGTVVEGPQPAARAAARFAAAGLADRATSVAGDLFTADLPAADAYVLARVVHNCGDEAACALLARTREALRPGGHLLVVDGVVPDPPVPHPMIGSDLRMLAYLGAKERTRAEHEALLAASGFALVDVRLADAPVSLLVAQAA